MKVSLNWVKEFTDVNLPIDELVKKIGAQLGAVEEVIDLNSKYKGIVIAKVVKCEPHPNADKLKVCTIDDGGNTPNVNRDANRYVQVVCGAPNVKEGLQVAWLPPGTTVPSTYGKEPLVLEARDIRGVVSNGMLASAKELDLSNDHEGIMELIHGQPGDDFAQTVGLDDYVIDIENKMFTHRPDLFGMLGVAREIAGITGQQFKSPGRYLQFDNYIQEESKLELIVHNNLPKLVPRFMVRVMESVQVKPSSELIQAALTRVGTRPINNIVDVTNYEMYYSAQPLHAYDYDKLCKVTGTKTAQLETRLSKKGDKLKLLNGKTITFDDTETILITSNDVPVGIGGVMGGADTEVDETTKNIVIECANFDMYAIRRASMRHGLFTDAVTRFNKGQSRLQNPMVLQSASGLMEIVTRGKAGKIIDEHEELKPPVAVQVSEQFINERLGLELDAKAMATLLTNVEFEAAVGGSTLTIKPPFWRTDIEIPEDIVEEVGRLYGYDHLPLELPRRDITPAKKDETLTLKQKIREALAKAGANEVLTYSFVHGNLLDKVGQDKTKAFQLSNALSPDLQYYRISLTPSLLDKVHMNIKAGYDHFALFELGKSHIKGQYDLVDKELPKEFENLALVVTTVDKIKPKGAAYYDARHQLDYLASVLGVELRYEALTEESTYPSAAPYDYKRSARVYIGEKLIGLVGEFKSSVRSTLKLPAHTAGFEIGISPNYLTSAASKYRPLSRYPTVEQDITLKVPANVTYQQVYELLAQQLLSQENTRADLEPIDIYQSEKDDTHINMTFRLSIAHYEKTLKSEVVNSWLDQAANAAHEKLGAERI